jgi:zinc protease
MAKTTNVDGSRALVARRLAIPNERFSLENGLEVVLHEDPRLPRVVVDLHYRVGSRDDPPGRTGLAHLFEHLMFMGTRRVPGKKFDLIMEEAGGWNNAYTSSDGTAYYDVGPSGLLELLLWIEADRMSSLGELLDAEKLELQREVVRNEYRQSYETAPYGKVQLAMPGLLYGRAHPYGWPILGHLEDLDAISVDDARSFFGRYYSPQNASLVVAGSFDPRAARGLVEKYFGWIPNAPGASRRPPPRLGGARGAIAPPPPPAPPGAAAHEFVEDVQLPRLYLDWHAPAHLAPGDAELDLLAVILSGGKCSRLFRALVYDRPLALEVDAMQESRELGSLFSIEATASMGVTIGELRPVIDEIVEGVVEQPPSEEELARAKNSYETEFVAKLEEVQRRAELLNSYLAWAGTPDWVEEDLERYRRVTLDDLHAASRSVLGPGRRPAVFEAIPAARRSEEVPS